MNEELKNKLIEMIQFHFQATKNVCNKITFKQLKLKKSTIDEIERILNSIETNIIHDIENME